MNAPARVSCRICGHAPLGEIIDFGDQRIAGVFRAPGVVVPEYPLRLVRCRKCGLVQLRHTVPAHELYDEYWYRSGVNRSMTENLHGIARQAEELAGLHSGDLVVDIGCNDGTLLDGYSSSTGFMLGIDPSNVARYAVVKGYPVINDFFSYDTLPAVYRMQRAHIVTSIAMLYDLEHPAEFVADVARLLAPAGIWVSEFSHLPTMLAQASFDTVCHEHLEYYSLSVVERLLADAGLEVVRAELNDVNGGSLRVFAGHQGCHRIDHAGLEWLRAGEAELASDEPYREFHRRVVEARAALLELLWSLDGSVHVYGASTKGNTLLQYADIGPELVPYAADRNPDKWGLATATGIPIISEEESRAMRPDYYLALPWHFMDEFVEREHDFLSRGGKFIVPLPQVRVLGAVPQAA